MCFHISMLITSDKLHMFIHIVHASLRGKNLLNASRSVIRCSARSVIRCSVGFDSMCYVKLMIKQPRLDSIAVRPGHNCSIHQENLAHIPIKSLHITLDQRFPTGGEFPPRGEFSISQGGNSSLPRFKKNYAQDETETILELMICREPYRTN